MLFLKRSLTSVILWIPLFIFLFVLMAALGGGVVGGIAGMENPDHAREAGAEAGKAFGETFGPYIMLGSGLLSFVISIALSFTGVLPWCRSSKSSEFNNSGS